MGPISKTMGLPSRRFCPTESRWLAQGKVRVAGNKSKKSGGIGPPGGGDFAPKVVGNLLGNLPPKTAFMRLSGKKRQEPARRPESQ
jgi:hypothetical protein